MLISVEDLPDKTHYWKNCQTENEAMFTAHPYFSFLREMTLALCILPSLHGSSCPIIYTALTFHFSFMSKAFVGSVCKITINTLGSGLASEMKSDEPRHTAFNKAGERHLPGASNWGWAAWRLCAEDRVLPGSH